MSITPWSDVKRDTPADLFNAILKRVKDNGYYSEAKKIMDYTLAEDFDKRKLTDYEFNFVAKVNFGGSEGIYIDCYLHGKFDESGKEYCSVGTFKTLRDDIGAMRIMGELCGTLTYYASRYVNENIQRYTSAKELEAESKRIYAPKELLERFAGLFAYHPITTTQKWIRFLRTLCKTPRDFDSVFLELIEAFEKVKETYSALIAESIYHNIGNSPEAPITPDQLEQAARYLQNGGDLDQLRWVCLVPSKEEV